MVHRVRVTVGLDQNDKKNLPDVNGEAEDNGNIMYKDPKMLKVKTKNQNTLPTSSSDIRGQIMG